MDANNIESDGDEQIAEQNATKTNDFNKTLNRTTESSSFEMLDSLVDICRNNIEYFETDTNANTSKRFLDAFGNILQQIEIVRQYIREFNGFAHEYDFDEITPANGYRSIVKVTHQYIKHTLKVAKHIAENRTSLLFRKQTYLK